MNASLLGGSQDLHDLLIAYKDQYPDDVLTISQSVSPVEEITAIVWELAGRDRHELLHFTDVQDLGVEVLTNMFASRQRVARILGTDVQHLHAEYEKRARDMVEPRVVDDAPILAHVVEGDKVDLETLPRLQQFGTDRAPYISSGVIVAEGASGRGGNMSYHRAMLHSSTSLATSLHSRGHLWLLAQEAAERGEGLPIAMVIGGHPLFMLAAAARLPAAVDERDVAGGLMGEPLEVVRTPRYGIRVPASADYVLEGLIEPGVEVVEGPFGEFSGYSSDRSTRTLLSVQSMLRRESPMLANIVGGNSAEHLNVSRIPRESEMAGKLKDRFPSVVAVHYPNSGTHFHCYVSVNQRRPGEARQVMLGLLGWDPYLKTVIAVDDDIDLSNDREVLWALATRFQPDQDSFMVDGLPGSPLDPSSSSVGTTSRLALDATRGPDFNAARHVLSDGAAVAAREILTGR
jgi:2,5-furandicarboxylate decarboxylase 1